MGNSFYSRCLFLLIIYMSFVDVSRAQETVEIYPNLKSQKKLKLCAVFTNTVFRNENPDEFMKTLKSAIDKYKINVVNAHHFSTDQWVSYKGYDKVTAKPDQNSISKYRSYHK